MLATAVIVFREVIEAALIIGIVMAATRGVVGRSRWIWGGVLAGLFGASVGAYFADRLAETAAGMGQELFNATILFSAVLMLGWHNIWMQSHGREMAQEMKSIGQAVVSGDKPLYALALVVGLAVLREGAEVVLFLFGIISAGEHDSATMLAGGVLGILSGSAVGATMYFGLLKIPARHLFSVTSSLILLLAAGLSAQGVGYLVQADILPPLGREVWDTSDWLAEDSLTGQLLHTLVGYIARPDGIQLLAYVITLMVIWSMMRWATIHAHSSAVKMRN